MRDMSEARDQLTLILVMRENYVLLGIKKTGFGIGRWNAMGGKIEIGETPLQGALRELAEESGLVATEAREVARVLVDYQQTNRKVKLHVFLVTSFSGEVIPTAELEPQWIPIDEVPYEQMWPNDIYWLPFVLKGKMIKASFVFRTEEAIVFQSVEEVTSLE